MLVKLISYSLACVNYDPLKKLFGLALIVLLLMNSMGYFAIFYGIQVRSDRKITSLLNKEKYDASQTITIKVPLSIPYLMDQTEFQRIDGQFAHEGRHYRMIKQKYAMDTLTIICLRDTNSEQIQTALSDYVKTFADNPQDSKGNSKTFSFIKDYVASTFSLVSSLHGWRADVSANTLYTFSTSTHIKSITHPPERA